MSETKRTAFLLSLSFIEGGSVMSCELIGAKLMAPYFGTSLYVWAAVLGLTLGGLTTGYFIGGILSKKYYGSSGLLYITLLMASILFCLMPWLAKKVMPLFIGLSLELGTVLSLLIYLVPPLSFMGMVSPIIINLLTVEAPNAGQNAGRVYAVSTLGGILFTFLMGFWIIPAYGLQLPAIVNAVLLGIVPLVLLASKNKICLASSVLLILAIALSSSNIEKYTSSEYRLLYKSEGILGQVKVVDHPAYEFERNNKIGRALLVNNTLQTFVGVDNNLSYSIWDWAQYFPTAASVFPKGSDVLLLGLGGGTLVKQLDRLGFNVDVVEIDKRIHEVSVKYFNMDSDIKVYIDDARHYIRTCNKKYDIIIYDTFLSESVPEHLLTTEGFKDARKILKQDGMVMSNFYGFINGKKGLAARSVYKTFIEAGFDTEILATPGEEKSRNLIFIASDNLKDFSKVNYSEPGQQAITELYSYFIDKRFLNTDNLEALSDYKPKLAKMYNPLAKSWKDSYNDYYNQYFKD